MSRSMRLRSPMFSPTGLALLLIAGCLPPALADDQRIASTKDRATVDPAPAPRDFRGQNDRHKVVVAVVDTGVDYNHPLLAQHIHFSLDASGNPVGLGRDLVGDDPWPSPYLARTSRYDTRVDGSARAASMLAWANARLLVRAYPDMARFYHPSRDLAKERASRVFHGTHVAGLMVYDRPDIGLLAYRVLPHNRYIGKGDGAKHDYDADLVKRIDAAVKAAASDGARVVNMSLGGDSNIDNPESYKKLEAWSAELRKTVLRYPNVLFVVAAGNASRALDGTTRVAYPCGIQASNVLCVGALRENGDPTTFTNFPLSGVDVVFALGDKVLSTMPTNICPGVDTSVLEKEDPSDEALKKLATETREKCGKAWFLARLSGTSMAAPLAAHLAAEILAELPELPAADVIREMQRRSTHTFIGGLPVYKIRFKKPSWYALEPVAKPDDKDKPTRDEDTSITETPEPTTDAEPDAEYWEAYLPGSRTE